MPSIPGPSRAAAVDHLREFLPRAGLHYRARRNHDLGAGAHEHVSRLAPHLRRRLVTEAEVARTPLTEPPSGPPQPPQTLPVPRDAPSAVLLTEDAAALEQLSLPPVAAVATLPLTQHRSVRPVADRVAAFDAAALDDAACRLGATTPRRFEALDPNAVVAWAEAAGAEQILVPHPCVGWTRDALQPLLAGPMPVVAQVRAWDEALWPLSTAGFFRFDKRARRLLPDLLARAEAA